MSKCKSKPGEPGKDDNLDPVAVALKSQYRCLVYSGAADGSNMTPQFDEDDLFKKRFILKSIRLIPYVPAGSSVEDFFVTDGVTPFIETIPANARLDRIFDDFTVGTAIRFLLNGVPVSVFSQEFTGTSGQYIPDLWLDNIFYEYPQPLQSISLAIFSTVMDSIETPAASVILSMKVIIECYLRP